MPDSRHPVERDRDEALIEADDAEWLSQYAEPAG